MSRKNSCHSESEERMSDKEQILNMITNFELKVKTYQDAIAQLHKVVERLDSGNITLTDLKQEAVRISTNGMVASFMNNQPTYFERIAAFFVKIGNVPKTIREIADATKITKNSINNVLYATHKTLFVSSEVEGFKHRLAWCLTPENFQKLLAS